MRNATKSQSDGSDEKAEIKKTELLECRGHEDISALQLPVLRLTLRSAPRAAPGLQTPCKQKRLEAAAQGTNAALPARQHRQGEPDRTGRGRAEIAAPGAAGGPRAAGRNKQTRGDRETPPPPARSGRNARGSARTAALRLTSAAPGLLRRRRRRHTLGPGAPRRRCRVRTATGRGARAEPAARLRRAERGRAGLGLRAAGRPAATSCTPSAEGRNGLCLRPSLGSGGGVGGSRFPSLRGIPPNKKRAAKQKGWKAAAMCRFCSSLAPGEALGDRAVVKRRDKETTKDDAVTQSCQCHTEPLAFICLLEKRPGQRSR